MQRPSHTVLIATDGSPDALAAADVAADLAQRMKSPLHLVHAWQIIPLNSTPEMPMGSAPLYMEGELEQAGRELLDGEVARLRAAGATVAEAHLRVGPAAGEIIDTARAIGAALIVVGGSEAGRLERFFGGDTTEGVIHHSHVPVLAVRGGAGVWPPRRIVIGDDGSAPARASGTFAAAIGGLYGASATIVRSHPSTKEPVGAPDQDLTDYAATIADRLGREPEVRVVDGDPADALLTAAGEGGDTLIAVGSRGLGAFQRLFSGSVSTDILEHAAGAVLVTPAADATPQPAPTDEAPESAALA